MEWENKQRMEQNSVSNQGTMNQPFYIPPPGGNGGYGRNGNAINNGYGGYGGNNMYPQANSVYPNYPRNPSKIYNFYYNI